MALQLPKLLPTEKPTVGLTDINPVLAATAAMYIKAAANINLMLVTAKGLLTFDAKFRFHRFQAGFDEHPVNRTWTDSLIPTLIVLQSPPDKTQPYLSQLSLIFIVWSAQCCAAPIAEVSKLSNQRASLLFFKI